jgi:hypothetical protein
VPLFLKRQCDRTPGAEFCYEAEEVDNGILAPLFSALIALPLIATMHLAFRWVRIGKYALVTSQYSATTLYQVSYHIQSLVF